MTTQPESTEPEGNPVPEAAETLGSLLRRTRQDKKVALEVAAKDTRIHAITLKALEDDNRGELPAEVFTRGFVKIYAQYLGLDPDQALRLYLHHRGEKTAIPDEKINAQEVLAGEAMAEAPAFHAERHLFAAAVVILITLILYVGYKITAPPPPEPPAPAQISEPLPPAQATLPPAEETVQQQAMPAAETLPAPPAAANPQTPAAVPPAATPAALPLPAAPAAIPTAPAVPAKTAQAEPPVPPKPAVPAAPTTTPPKTISTVPAPPAPPASGTRQTPPIAPQATLPPVPPPAAPPAKAAQATQNAPVPPKTALPAAPPPTMPAATVTTKPPLKELAPPGPIKKEKTAAAAPITEAEKPAKEPSTAEKLIAAIKPLRPPYALEATFREDTWVRVQLDNEKPKPQYFRAGDKSAWQANSKIQLFIGNAGGVDLVLNNTRLPPLGKPGNTTRISIQPQPDQR